MVAGRPARHEQVKRRELPGCPGARERPRLATKAAYGAYTKIVGVGSTASFQNTRPLGSTTGPDFVE